MARNISTVCITYSYTNGSRIEGQSGNNQELTTGPKNRILLSCLYTLCLGSDYYVCVYNMFLPYPLNMWPGNTCFVPCFYQWLTILMVFPKNRRQQTKSVKMETTSAWTTAESGEGGCYILPPFLVFHDNASLTAKKKHTTLISSSISPKRWELHFSRGFIF